MALLDGSENAYRDIVLLNAATALLAGGHVENLAEGGDRARHAIASGAAKAALDHLVRITNEAAPA